jgi:hypothetical protein
MMHISPRNDDPLAELLDGAAGTARQVTPPASYQPQGFEEKCKKCGGSGRFARGRFVGQCFTCKGTGKKVFATAPEARQQARAGRARRTVQSAETNLYVFKAAQPEVYAWFDGNDFPFAVAMKEAVGKYGDLTVNQLAACHKIIAKRDAAKAAAAERIASAPGVDAAGVDRLKEAFDKAKAYSAAKGRGIHLRNPKITIGNMTISPAKETSKNAGALYVKSGEQYLGKVVGGKFFASGECSADQAAKVLAFVADPGGAAKAYGKETGVCCVCNAALTSEWRFEGIGPICSQKMGW